MDIVVIVLASIIVVAAWSVYWALRLRRQWLAMWAAVREFVAVADELQSVVSSVGADASDALVARADRAPARLR